MVDPEWRLIELAEFPGLIDLIDSDSLPANLGAISVVNAEFLPTQVSTRQGVHAFVVPSADTVSEPLSLKMWHHPTYGIWLTYFNHDGTTDFHVRPISNFIVEELYTLGSGLIIPRTSAYGENLYVTFPLYPTSGPVALPGIASDVPVSVTPFPSASSQTFSGSGLNDATMTSTNSSFESQTVWLRIDSTGTPDTFKISRDGGVTWEYNLRPITGGLQAILGTGAGVTFGATTGHTLNDTWKRTYTIWKFDKLLQGPYSYTPSAPTEPSAGVITPGVHKLGYIIEHRNGFVGRFSPHAASTSVYENLQPVSFTAAGSKNLSWVLNPTVWPITTKKVHVVMSPVSDPDRFFFVPGANATISSPGSAESKTITFSISDNSLIANAIEATDHLFLLTATGTASTTGTEYGNIPTSFRSTFSYGDRVCYLCSGLNPGYDFKFEGSVLLVSEREKPQHVIIGKHLLKTSFPLTCGLEVNKLLILFSDDSTYSTFDNGLDPINWPIPTRVSGKLGASFQNCVHLSADGTYAWVVHSTGLYLFDGTGYTRMPMSWNQQTTWDTISKPQMYKVQITEEPQNRRVFVAFPTTTSTVNDKLFVWDFTNGFGPDDVKCSEWTITTGTRKYCLGFLDNLSPVSKFDVSNPTVDLSAPHGQQTLIVATNKILSTAIARYAPTLTHRDFLSVSPDGVGTSSAIDFTYETGQFKSGSPEIHIATGFTAMLTGSGTLTPTIYGRDRVRNASVSPVDLASAPGYATYRRAHLISENFSLRFALNSLDGYVQIKGLKFYMMPYAHRR